MFAVPVTIAVNRCDFCIRTVALAGNTVNDTAPTTGTFTMFDRLRSEFCTWTGTPLLKSNALPVALSSFAKTNAVASGSFPKCTTDPTDKSAFVYADCE